MVLGDYKICSILKCYEKETQFQLVIVTNLGTFLWLWKFSNWNQDWGFFLCTSKGAGLLVFTIILWYPDMRTSANIYIALIFFFWYKISAQVQTIERYVKKKINHHYPFQLLIPFCLPKLMVTVWHDSFDYLLNSHFTASLQITKSIHV